MIIFVCSKADKKLSASLFDEIRRNYRELSLNMSSYKHHAFQSHDWMPLVAVEAFVAFELFVHVEASVAVDPVVQENSSFHL